MAKKKSRRKPKTQTQQPFNRGTSPLIRVAGTVGFFLVAIAIIGSMVASSFNY